MVLLVMKIESIGEERVEYHLTKSLLWIERLKLFKNKKFTLQNQNKINSLNNRISNHKKKLVFLSTKARNKITRFYALNALKEISQKLRE